jgi:hypothetical protein
MGESFAAMTPDLFFMTPAEKRWLAFNKAELPENAVVAGQKPVTMILGQAPLRVGVVLFPMLPEEADNAPSHMEKAVAEAARRLRAKADMVVGMSPWGEAAEAHFLINQEPVFHLLLGSGPGKGLLGRLAGDDKCLWVRAFTRGIAMNKIDVLTIPDDDNDWRWIYGENFMVQVMPLSEGWPLDMTIYGLLSPFPNNMGG